MVWYVALVAIVNLALGYALAVFLGASRQKPTASPDEANASLESSVIDRKKIDEPLAVHIVADPPADIDEAPTLNEHPAAAATAADEAPVDENTDPTTGMTTREHIAQRLADMTMAHADLQPMTVALVEVEQATHGGENVDDRLLRGVAETVRELLAEVHTAGRYSDHQFLLLLPHDDLQHATERAEQIRQRVAATQYVADGEQLQTTVTCALTQVAASHTAENLLEFVEETLEEAKRYGGNRTFMHDGSSPTPVVAPELDIAPQTCAI